MANILTFLAKGRQEAQYYSYIVNMINMKQEPEDN